MREFEDRLTQACGSPGSIAPYCVEVEKKKESEDDEEAFRRDTADVRSFLKMIDLSECAKSIIYISSFLSSSLLFLFSFSSFDFI